ncbi:hypothetical protein HK100_010155, partial [Physocladia obscura]
AGYGILGIEYHPNGKNDPSLHCPRTNENSSWFHSYGAIIGRHFNAQVSTVALSGWGISRGYGGAPNDLIPTIYSTLLGKWSDLSYSFSTIMDAVLINLGGNDWSGGDPGVVFENAYLAFLKSVRAKNPKAHIFLTLGPWVNPANALGAKTRVNNVMKKWVLETGDENISYFDFGCQNHGSNWEIPTGSDWHPNVLEHKRSSRILINELLKIGWKSANLSATAQSDVKINPSAGKKFALSFDMRT